MSTTEEKLKNVRTMEDVVKLLTILFTNLNNQNEIYYNMFLNPEPMDLELERYDENGDLVTVTLANRAKDRIWMRTGSGSPSSVAASAGTFYLDTSNSNLYFKAYGDDAQGWQLVWSNNNLKENIDFLSPTGNGSQLTDLNASNIKSGTLAVQNGGTGRGSLNSGKLLQGNGFNPILSDLDVTDVISALNEFIGMIMYCPYSFEDESELGRWLVCDGRAVSRTTYSALFNKVGTKYGAGDGSTTFNLPNLIEHKYSETSEGVPVYIKSGSVADVGTYVKGSVASHTHSLENCSTKNESEHTHGPGSLNATGRGPMWFSGANTTDNDKQFSGVFSPTSVGVSGYRGVNDKYVGSNDPEIQFNLQSGWDRATSTGSGEAHKHALEGVTGTAGSGDTNEVDHVVMVPVIRY